MNISKTILLVATLNLTGCYHQLTQDKPQPISTKHIFKKNYQLGETKKASVGEAVIQVKDYYAKTIGESTVVASEAFTIDGPMLHLSINEGQVFSVKGQVNIDSINYAVVPFDNNFQYFRALLVNDSGMVKDKIVSNTNAGLVPVIYTYDINPKSVRLSREVSEKVLAEKGYQNYEILYNGNDKNSMLFTYREFSPEGLAKTAFYQNLTYESKAKTIKFKNFKINIISSNNEGIEYIVTEDSISN